MKWYNAEPVGAERARQWARMSKSGFRVFFRPLCSVTKQQAEKSWVTGFLWWKQLISPRSRWKVNAALLPRKYWLKANKVAVEGWEKHRVWCRLLASFVKGWKGACLCLNAFIHLQYVHMLPYVLGGYFVVLHACATCMFACLCACVYSWSDRVNPVVCESELFIELKPMRPSILSVTNDYLPPCMRTQTSRFSIWMARVVVLCLFYVFTRV